VLSKTVIFGSEQTQPRNSFAGGVPPLRQAACARFVHQHGSVANITSVLYAMPDSLCALTACDPRSAVSAFACAAASPARAGLCNVAVTSAQKPYSAD